jgi:endonuclease/exonuclease/phosphatase family metal-dependent hydrolase
MNSLNYVNCGIVTSQRPNKSHKYTLMKNARKFTSAFLVQVLLFTTPLFSLGQSTNETHGGQLKIITWNIYMLPHYWIHTGQLKRAARIAEALKTQDADVVVFEEAFDRKSRAILRAGLRDSFPYESGDPRKAVWWKANCGVWIMSKVPIEVVKQIFYKEARGSDRLASKGAIMVEGKKNGVTFQLVGTHLQSDLNSGRDVQPVRNRQYAELRKELLEPYAKDNIPQFVAGDFNTIRADTTSYSKMVSTLKLTQCSMEGDRSYSYDYAHNDFILNTPGSPQLIDYLFYNKAAKQQLGGTMHIVVFQKRWDFLHKDLSDHFAVAGTFNF